jgi:protein-S-isoprenylcysteine O-methyltransferase
MVPIIFVAPWRGLFWLSYLAWVVLEIWVFARDRKVARGEKQDRGSIYAVIGIIMLGLAAIFNTAFTLRFAQMHLPYAAIYSAALLFMWAGLILRFWAVRTLGRFFRTTVFLQDEHRLITSGPYRLLRHPSYTGAVLVIAGVGLAMANWLSLLIGLLTGPLAYLWRIRVEEAALEAQFGESFRRNRAHTWAVIPFIW